MALCGKQYSKVDQSSLHTIVFQHVSPNPNGTPK